MTQRAKKVQEQILPKPVLVKNVMFKRKATKVSIGGTEEEASRLRNDTMMAIKFFFTKSRNHKNLASTTDDIGRQILSYNVTNPNSSFSGESNPVRWDEQRRPSCEGSSCKCQRNWMLVESIKWILEGIFENDTDSINQHPTYKTNDTRNCKNFGRIYLLNPSLNTSSDFPKNQTLLEEQSNMCGKCGYDQWEGA